MPPEPAAGTALPAPFRYLGPPGLAAPVTAALRRVVDPEVAMNIVDLGLVHDVTVADGRLHLRMTMTSAACPVVDVIVDDVEAELDRAVPPELALCVELVWTPPWTPEHMSESARRFMQW